MTVGEWICAVTVGWITAGVIVVLVIHGAKATVRRLSLRRLGRSR